MIIFQRRCKSVCSSKAMYECFCVSVDYWLGWWIIINIRQMEEDAVGPFNYNYIKAVHHFESLALEGQELHFQDRKFCPPFTGGSQRQVTSLAELEEGINTLVYIRFSIIRVIRLEYCTYMLATTSRPFKRHTLAVLVVINSESKQSAILQECLMPRVQVRVANPFRREAEGDFIPQLFINSEHVTIISSESSEKASPTSDQLREQANTFFKNRKYVQAVLKYEHALVHTLGPSSKNRSILYSNTAACLFELRLFSSCALYADLAVLMDPSYNKGYYRKINSFLELKRYSEVIPLLAKIHGLISRADFESLNLKYTQYLANESGVFNWQAIVKQQGAQGEYTSQKIEKVRTEEELQYFARESIAQYQVLLVSKPLIYIRETGTRFKESFIVFLKEIENYYLYDELFEESIHFLPCKCHPTFKERQLYYQHYKHLARPLPKKELFNKMQRCIFEEKSLDKTQAQNGYGIWKEMFHFQNKCIPNCTGVHINGCLVVTALTPIEKGTPLSIDLIADVQSAKRKETLSIKFDVECGCEICEFKESSNIEFNRIEELYDRFQKYQVSKIKKQHLWAIINYEWEDREVLEEEFVQLIYYYIYVIQKECEWDDVLNLLRLKEETDSAEINSHIDEAIKRILQKYLRIGEKDLDLFYSCVIQKYIPPKQR